MGWREHVVVPLRPMQTTEHTKQHDHAAAGAQLQQRGVGVAAGLVGQDSVSASRSVQATLQDCPPHCQGSSSPSGSGATRYHPRRYRDPRWHHGPRQSQAAAVQVRATRACSGPSTRSTAGPPTPPTVPHPHLELLRRRQTTCPACPRSSGEAAAAGQGGARRPPAAPARRTSPRRQQRMRWARPGRAPRSPSRSA